jgi:hypothetical protein
MLARVIYSRSGLLAERAQGITAMAEALLSPLFGEEDCLNVDAYVAGQAAVDLLTRALADDPELGPAMIAGHASTRTAAGPGPKASWHASGSHATATRRAVDHALDGLACAIALATALPGDHPDVVGTALIELGRGVAFRDLGLTRIAAESRDWTRPRGWQAVAEHPAIGVQLIERVLGATPSWTSIVAGHHRRLDGSGYPAGRFRGRLSFPIQIAGLADMFASRLASERGLGARGASDLVAVLGSRTIARFDAALVGAFVETLHFGRLLPDELAAARRAPH